MTSIDIRNKFIDLLSKGEETTWKVSIKSYVEDFNRHSYDDVVNLLTLHNHPMYIEHRMNELNRQLMRHKADYSKYRRKKDRELDLLFMNNLKVEFLKRKDKSPRNACLYSVKPHTNIINIKCCFEFKYHKTFDRASIMNIVNSSIRFVEPISIVYPKNRKVSIEKFKKEFFKNSTCIISKVI